ncbi:MAG TPA: hypothetical protein VFS92_08555, partial [Planctomycetota bacterium]|nr:hypothetical protein [Planctomycetota bacterium]
MSRRPTDRRRASARIALLAALAAVAGPPPALAGEGSGDKPVFFRQPDAETARDIRKSIERFDLPSARDREQARDRLFDIGYWSVEPLVDTVVHKQASFRSNALLVLGRLGDPRALPVARATLRDNVAEWPPAIAALVLGTMHDGDSEALDAFKQAIASRENEKRKIAVVLALGKLHRVHPGRGAVLIEEVLAAPTATPFVHYAAVLALGFHRNRVSEPAPDGNGFVPSARLRAALADSREGMRLSAVLALALSPQDSFRPVFLERFREDGDKDVRLVSLLALGRPGRDPDPEITALIAAVLESTKPSDAERRLAAYLLQVRADPASRDALIRTANAPRSTEVAAAAVLALAGIDDPRAREVIFSKLAAGNATVRAAAAIALTRLKTMEDLSRARAAIAKRLEMGEPDNKCKFDMQLAADEIVKSMRDIQDRAQGIEPKPRLAPPWEEADAKDLFQTLGRTHRERVFDFVNARARQVLGVSSLLDYRPRSEPDFSTPTLDGTGGGGGRRAMRDNGAIGEPRDLEVELLRRPYFAPEDDPEGAPA